MQRERLGEIAWGATFSLVAMVGVIALLPTDERATLLMWIEAFGGWAAAAVAVPSIILLSRQNALASIPATQMRMDDLREEMEVVQNIRNRRTAWIPNYYWQLVEVPGNEEKISRFISEYRDKCGIISNQLSDDARKLEELWSKFPNRELADGRDALVSQIHAHRMRLIDARNRLEVMIRSKDPAAVVVGISTEIDEIGQGKSIVSKANALIIEVFKRLNVAQDHLDRIHKIS